jgi:molybdopterin-guanine dinucleotide biosynthesis protein B
MDPDMPGTDTYRFNHNGAYGTVITDSDAYMLVKRKPTDLLTLIGFFPEADLILLEGYKDTDWPKIEMRRDGKACDVAKETVIARVSDAPAPVSVAADQTGEVPTFLFGDFEKVARFIHAYYLEMDRKKL